MTVIGMMLQCSLIFEKGNNMSVVQLLQGFELEGWIAKEGKPFDVPGVLPLPVKGGTLSIEAGPGSIEYVGDYASTLHGAIANVGRVHGSFRAEMRRRGHAVDICFDPESPFVRETETPPRNLPERYASFWSACRQEVCGIYGPQYEGWKGMLEMSYRSALHAHYSVAGRAIVRGDGIDDDAMFVTNVLNYFGPWIARAICNAVGIPKCGHLGIWSGWAHPERFSTPQQWFSDFEAYKAHFESLPRLIEKTGEGMKQDGWAVDLVNPLEWGKPDDEGAGRWPFIRPRSKFGTLEVRLLPSMPVQTMRRAVIMLQEVMIFLFENAPKHPVRSLSEFFGTPAWLLMYRDLRVGGQSFPANYTAKQWLQDVKN